MKELEDCLREALEESPYGMVTNETALETARKYAHELLQQRDELREALINVMVVIKDCYPLLFDNEKTVVKQAEAAIKNTERK